jgi:hypothetical protein
MLALPRTRQMIDIQALNQRETSKKPFCPKIAAVWKYILCHKKIISDANLTKKIKYKTREIKLVKTC